jgi:hypothetical protein
MCDGTAPFYETGMHPDCPAMPWMPSIMDFTQVPNMGVVFAGLYHFERNHQGKGNLLLFHEPQKRGGWKRNKCRQRLGGLLKYYTRVA